MRPRWIAVTSVVVLCASSACTIHEMPVGPLNPAAIAEVQRALNARGAKVEYTRAGQAPTFVAVSQGDYRVTASGNLQLLSEDQAIPIEDVRSIEVNNHGLGAAEGLGLGLLTGALAGSMLASGAKSSCNRGEDGCIGLDLSGAVITMTTIVGATVGLLVGAAVGQRVAYTF